MKAFLQKCQKFRIHVSMDNMILDGTAICAVLDEWNKLYKGEVLKSDIGKKTFKDYVNYLKTLELSSEYSMAQEYWNKKIVNMPPRPELPLLNKNVNGEFYRLSTVLQKEKWNVLKMLSAKYGITPSNVLLTSFSEVLYRWGKENKFTINLTINKKALLDSGYAKVLGEFTDTILVEVNAGKKRNFIEKCKSIQNELLNNLKYSSYNGVAVQRDWTKEHGFLMGTAFPIVFTSLLGTADLLDMPGKISYGLTQTPQVWLDYQVSEIAGKLYLNWDVLRGKYDDGVIAQMFSCYLDSLEKMTDRGRISKWISASAEENKKVDVAELPQNDLEEQIARIWCKELNIERIGRNDNFYLSGGDSLLIAQVIARMRETIEAAKRWSWDDLLKEMMKTPTIRGVAKILSNQAGENEQDKSLVIIKEAAESSEKKVTVVFHAGTGTLTPYNSLIAYITERSQENEAVMGFTFGDEAEYLAIPTDKIFENLGKKYGRILSELGFTEYTLIGHCVGGLIALETAHYLKDKGKNVSSVTLLSTSIPHKKEETVLADLDMKIFETAVQTSLYNELLLERTFASLIDADIKKAGHQVDNDTLQQVIEYLIFNNGGNITVQALCSLTGKFAEVGAEFQRLHSMSATERMNDLYTTIERPNGQLMEHQRKMLNVLFRVFAQNFRCVSSYIPKVYTGKMRVFDCESAIANFFPSLFSEDKKTWEQYAQGEFLFDTMKGDHISCMNSPYIEENVKKILDL